MMHGHIECSGTSIASRGTTAAPRLWLVLAAVLASLTAGCAAVTNPVADGIPVRRLPPEVFGPSRKDLVPIPMTLLEQPRSYVYRVGPGDVLGVWIDGVLGDRALAPPIVTAPQIEAPNQRRLPPAMGYPVMVREDGTLSLPLVPPVAVAGMTLPQIEETLRQKYTTPKQILQPGFEHIVVTLLQARQHHVVVLREEASSFSPIGITGVLLTGKRGTGQSIALPSGENDVLHALALTGGLPGLDTYDEVIIQRGYFKEGEDVEAVRRQLEAGAAPAPECVRIPLRVHPGDKLPFGPKDVVLHTGDVVYLHARDGELFYTGGLLPSGEHVLPRDRDLDVVEAVAATRGPLINGAFVNNNLAGNLINPGIGYDSPALLVVVRRLPGGGQIPIRVNLNQALRDPRERINVQPGDLLILQELPNAAIARFMGTTLFNFNMAYIPFTGNSMIGVGDVSTSGAPGRIGVGNYTTTPLR